jgi:hypothetical protein
MKKSKDIIQELVETGADISGGIAGSVIGGIIAGPVGMIIGGASGPVLTRVFRKIGQEIKLRFISPREEIRIGAVFAFAINKLQENLQNGSQIRTDSFFDSTEHFRAGAEEILEGVILGAQKEYEEKKVKFLGNLYANICTNSEISREQANQFIKTINSLSYRQLCIIQILKEAKSDPPNSESTKTDDIKIKQHDIMIEIRDMQHKGLLSIVWRLMDIDDNSALIPINDINITESGSLFCEILSLNEIPKIELVDLNNILNLK